MVKKDKSYKESSHGAPNIIYNVEREKLVNPDVSWLDQDNYSKKADKLYFRFSLIVLKITICLAAAALIFIGAFIFIKSLTSVMYSPPKTHYCSSNHSFLISILMPCYQHVVTNNMTRVNTSLQNKSESDHFFEPITPSHFNYTSSYSTNSPGVVTDNEVAHTTVAAQSELPAQNYTIHGLVNNSLESGKLDIRVVSITDYMSFNITISVDYIIFINTIFNIFNYTPTLCDSENSRGVFIYSTDILTQFEPNICDEGLLNFVRAYNTQASTYNETFNKFCLKLDTMVL